MEVHDFHLKKKKKKKKKRSFTKRPYLYSAQKNSMIKKEVKGVPVVAQWEFPSWLSG